ncbi:MAG: hypothetical protein JSU03_06580 [Bacteroidetes bacterium]|nr:hypothetical protein [Bacteroidota bacterium]MBS1756926.1 hypothetical protein [Bacteroidota bacterium]
MNNFDDLEALWKAPRQLDIPAADAIIKKAVKEKNQIARKILVQSFCMCLALACIIYVMLFVHFKFIISYIGIAIMIICMVSYTIIRLRQSIFLKRVDFSQLPADLLQQFEKFHQHQKWINTKGVMWYTIFLNLGFAFYFYETVAITHINLIWKIVFIVIYISWMLLATLWLGKRSVRKEHAKTNAIIEKLKQLKEGLQ